MCVVILSSASAAAAWRDPSVWFRVLSCSMCCRSWVALSSVIRTGWGVLVVMAAMSASLCASCSAWVGCILRTVVAVLCIGLLYI